MSQFSAEVRQDKIDYALRTAQKNLQAAIDHLSGGGSALVEEFFGVSGSADSGAIQSLILKYTTLLNSLPLVRVEYEPDPPAQYRRRGVTAWTTYGSRVLTVVDEFFTQPRRKLCTTIIHEMSHMFLHTRDYAYVGQVGGMALKWLSPEKRQDNADSFAFFRAGGGEPLALQGAVSFASCVLPGCFNHCCP